MPKINPSGLGGRGAAFVALFLGLTLLQSSLLFTLLRYAALAAAGGWVVLGGRRKNEPDAVDHGDAWSTSWADARAAFRAAAAAAGAQSVVLPYTDSDGFGDIWSAYDPAKGDARDAAHTLTIDVAILGDVAMARALVFHTSGVHGVEGYAGSAVQLAALKRFAVSAPPPHVLLVFIHGINALGMAAKRRFNENDIGARAHPTRPAPGVVCACLRACVRVRVRCCCRPQSQLRP